MAKRGRPRIDPRQKRKRIDVTLVPKDVVYARRNIHPSLSQAITDLIQAHRIGTNK